MQNINNESESYSYTLQENETNHMIRNLKYGNEYKVTIDEIQNDCYVFNSLEKDVKIEKEETNVNLQYKHTSTYLFKNGNQCNTITGGWEIKPMDNTGWGVWNTGVECKYGISDTIYCYIKNPGIAEHSATVHPITKNKINFEEYKKVHVKYSINTINSTSPNDCCILHTYYSTSINIWAEKGGINYRDGGIDFGYNLPASEEGEISAEIKDLKQPDEYLSFYFSTFERGLNMILDAHIKEVWLEK